MADAGHKRFGSKLLARGGRREVVEGKMRARNVLREFNSYDEALAYYRGPEYSRAHPLREPHSACDFLIVEGYDGAAAAADWHTAAAGEAQGLLDRPCRCERSRGLQALQAANAGAVRQVRRALSLVRGGRYEVTEGRARSRTWCCEFPSYEARSPAIVRPNTRPPRRCAKARPRSNIVVIEARRT